MSMSRNRAKHVLAALTLGTLILAHQILWCQPLQVQYEVSVTNPMAKIFHVCAKIPGGGREFLQLDWPAWTPGYATIWNYGQHVLQMTALSESGETLQANRLSENRWVIVSHEAKEVRFCYDVRAIDTDNDLGFAQAYLDSANGWYNGAAIFPEIDGFRKVVHQVRFQLPAGWRVATAMKQPLQDGWFQVSDFDELVDSPVQLGLFLRKDITVAGIPIGIVVAGNQEVNMDDLATIVRKIAEYQFQFIRKPGIDRYLFIYHSGVRGAGGLEHQNSVTISLRREEYTKKDSWLKVVTSHEMFHVWNAKRIHTELFDHYDYSRPHRSKEVWFAEGITAYYTDLALYRVGLMTREELFKSLADVLDMYENNRAHSTLSWEDISWYIWDEEVRQGLGVWLLPGWMIDLRIRDASDNRFSLDDVMRYLNVQYGDAGRGYPQSGLGAICTAVAQRDIQSFFRDHISGYSPFPFDSLFNVAGLRWDKSNRQVPDIGCELFWSLQMNVKAISVEERGVAYAAGVRSGDVILSINGNTSRSRQDLAKIKSEMKIGDTLKLNCQRGSTEFAATVPVGARTLIKSTIVEVDHPTERQQRILNGILKGTPK
jgi:predicted metalloprotease with PDZ domain